MTAPVRIASADASNGGRTARDPAWGLLSTGEPRWPASLAVVAAVLLYVALPEKLQLPVGPPALRAFMPWLMPCLEVALLAALTLAAPRRRPGETRPLRYGAIALIALVNAANVVSLALLVDGLLHGSGKNGGQLLLSSIDIWLTNVLVFALWYWELDRCGPDDRSHPRHRHPDFLFPQMTTPHCTRAPWAPAFMDYLYVAFTNSTAFSPTDTLPLTPLAKSLMTVQGLASLLTIALVAARAVNILGPS